MKCKFGEKSHIYVDKTHLTKVAKGKQIANENKGLIELYYSHSDCIIMLCQLYYESDIYSTDTFCQTICRLPNKFYSWWGEYCLKLRCVREPTLTDMEAWLHDRIEASTDLYLPPKLHKQNEHHSTQGYKCNQNMGVHITGTNSVWKQINTSRRKEKHRIYKCQSYKAMNDLEKFNTVKEINYNCSEGDHFTSKCK